MKRSALFYSDLTDTKNTILVEDNYRYTSVESSISLTPCSSSSLHQNFELLTSKRKYELTSTCLKDSSVFSEVELLLKKDDKDSCIRKKNTDVETSRKKHKIKKLKNYSESAKQLCFMPDSTPCTQGDNVMLVDIAPELYLFQDAELPPMGPGQSCCFGSAAPWDKNKSVVMAPRLRQPHLRQPLLQFQHDHMPQYNLELHDEKSVNFDKSWEFLSLDDDEDFLLKKKNNEVKSIKISFVNAVSASLVYSPNYEKHNDFFRQVLIDCIEKLIATDPEFILKVAFYARQELNIRSTTNFLLAYSAYKQPLRKFLKKYFVFAVNLPTDLLEIADIYITLGNSHNLKKRSLSSSLRKVMITAFTKFDEYQLAKYNKNNKKNKKGLEASSTADVKKSFTLKQLIRTLHITSPVESVMCLLEKRYPLDPEDFEKCGMEGSWQPDRAGKKMKLPIPETWEAKISLEGNKPHVWETLIESSKLPYMAMLRNLQNLIMCGISKKCHKIVLKKIVNKNAILKSRQFPLRFYTAYKTIEEIEQAKEGYFDEEKNCHEPKWKKNQRMKRIERISTVSNYLLSEYKEALSKALEISALSNVPPISGRTIVICDLIKPFSRIDGYSKKVHHNAILLALMCFKACEYCELKLILANDKIENFVVNQQSLLENVSSISTMCDYFNVPADVENELTVGLGNLLGSYLEPIAMLNKKMNNIIFLQSSGCDGCKVQKVVKCFLNKYRILVNPDLLYTQVNVNTSFERGNSFGISENINDIYLNGSSDQILKFIAERGNGDQLAYIEGIDQKYKLCKDNDINKQTNIIHTYCPSSISLSPCDAPLKWQSLRLFISSTFKDMYGERDILMHYVIPKLKDVAFKMCVLIYEIDLRWGVTEEYSSTKKSSEICLKEAQNCDIFIGIIGERYGTVCSLNSKDDPQYSWIKEYPQGISVTELEIEGGVLRKESNSKPQSLFYFRDNKFLKYVPEKWSTYFESEDFECKEKVLKLKEKIRNSGLKLCDGYPCRWGGIFQETPFVAGLDEFGEMVFRDLCGILHNHYNKEKRVDEVTHEFLCQQSQIQLHSNYVAEENSPLQWLISQIQSKQGLFVVTGCQGCGKSAFMVKLIKEIGVDNVIYFFVNATARSRELSFMLNCISYFIFKSYPSSVAHTRVKEDLVNHFYDILVNGAAVSGNNLILVIDGLDHLDEISQTLNWLPFNIPTGIRIICSASDSSIACETLIKRAKYGSPVYFVTLNPLSVPDRKKIVQLQLAEYGKALDEKAFNNQMIQLITKVDCGIPMYIHLACSYLKMFATFENLMASIQNLPSTILQVIEAIIIQMEKRHGADIVRKALTLLCTAKEGLSETELITLLTISINHATVQEFDKLTEIILGEKAKDILNAVEFRSFLYLIYTFNFGRNRDSTIKLSSSVFVEVLKKTYVGHEKETFFCHKLLAAYYNFYCDNSFLNEVDCASAMRCLPFHLYHGGCYNQLAHILCSFSFIQKSFQMHSAEDILPYYVLMLNLEKNISQAICNDEIQNLKKYQDFILQNFHVLKKYPQNTIQQAINTFWPSIPDFSFEPHRLYLKQLIKSPNNFCTFTMKSLKRVTCATIHRNKPDAAIGYGDGYLKVFDHSTGKVTCASKTHSTAITSISFIGNDRICTISRDNTICIWNFRENILIATLEGHKRCITSCSIDPTEKFILSSSWDCTVRIWDALNGNEISVLSDFRCPVNCISHHPYTQSFVSGLWNGTMEIWDTLSLKRKKIIFGHTSSIKCVTYSADGLSILSSSITAEVFIWSSEQGLKIGSLKGHTLPVNSIDYCTLNNFFVSASDDCTVKVWSNQQEHAIHSINDCKFDFIQFVEIIDTEVLAAAFQNGEVWLFDLIDGHIIDKYGNFPSEISCFSKCYYTCKKKTTEFNCSILAICGLSSGKILALLADKEDYKIFGSFSSSVTALINTLDLILCGTSNGDIGLFSHFNSSEPSVINNAHIGSITTLSISMMDNDAWALSSSTGMTLKLWKISTHGRLSMSIHKTFNSKHKDYITSCLLLTNFNSSPDNMQFISGSIDNTIAVWNYNDDDEPMLLEGLHAAVMKVYHTKKYIIGCSQDGGVAMWTRSGSLISLIRGYQEQINCTSSDLYQDLSGENDINLTIAVAKLDGSVVIIKPLQKSLMVTLEGHSKSVKSCSINNTGTILTCAEDNTVNIWKIPDTLPSNVSYHEGNIMGVIFNALGFAFTADVNGKLILWTINKGCKDFEMIYCSHRKYPSSFINVISEISENRCICALTVYHEENTKYMLSIVRVNPLLSGLNQSYTILEEKCTYVSHEVTCITFCRTRSIIIVGLKSGQITLLNSKNEMYIQITNDWILGLCVSPDDLFLYAADPSGCIKEFSILEMLKSQDSKNYVKEVSLTQNIGSVWTTSICIDDQAKLHIGDSKGCLRIVTDGNFTTKQIHTDAITGVYVNESYIISCSLDRTIKIWNKVDINQVCQFYSSTPISCLTVCENNNDSIKIIVGTITGSINFFELWTT